MKRAELSESGSPVFSKTMLERERKVLLDLGNDITKVRDKKDLIVLFSKRLKSYFYFTHTLVALIDYKDETYGAFLLDYESSPIKSHPESPALLKKRFTLHEPFIQTVLQATGPVSFLLKEVKDQPQSPPFLRMNYEGGIREMLMTKLMNAEKPIGFFNIYSDRVGSFTNEFRSIINGIAPQLSSAISNIIKNEELLNKEKEKSFL